MLSKKLVTEAALIRRVRRKLAEERKSLTKWKTYFHVCDDSDTEEYKPRHVELEPLARELGVLAESEMVIGQCEPGETVN